ncbi:MAG: hypothetical protein JW943_11495 [Deltaproteobacteria bacterium]|nr:hypothetical protein [Deltaproteobacteria bacterium]
MAAGCLSIAGGIIIVKTPSLKRRYFKFHKTKGLAGAVSCLAGLTAAVVMVSGQGGGHLNVPHAYLGVMALLGVFCTASLGLWQFRWKAKAQEIRNAHRWFGRISSLLLLAAVISGLLHAGIF